jgi:LPXTG-motif cell wall-anchored protein
MNNLKVPLGVAASLLLFGEQTNAAGLLAGSLLMAAALATVVAARKKS